MNEEIKHIIIIQNKIHFITVKSIRIFESF